MRRALLLFALGFLPLGAPAQTTSPDGKSVSEPEFNEVFYRLDAGKLMPLEHQNTGTTHVSMGFSMKGTIEIPGGKSPVRFRAGERLEFEIPGGKSPVRFRAGERLEFVVRSGLSAAQDPSSAYHLRVLSIKKDKRVLLIMTVKGRPFGATAKTGSALGELPLEFTRYGAASVKATTASLPPGEYAVGLGIPGQAVFCFGVD